MARRRRRRGLSGLGASKKDYNAFADVLCQHKASEGLINGISPIFTEDNPRFDRQRFYEKIAACKISRR